MTMTAVRSATGRRLLLLVLLAVASTAFFAVRADQAQALCSGHAAEYGNWVNADPNARGIARIELRDCQAVTVCDGDICSIQYDVGWVMRTYGKCSPSNCDWGWTSAKRRLSSGQIPGTYDQGFAKRYVYAKTSQYRPGQLWVYWRTDFTDPNRPVWRGAGWRRR